MKLQADTVKFKTGLAIFKVSQSNSIILTSFKEQLSFLINSMSEELVIIFLKRISYVYPLLEKTKWSTQNIKGLC